MKFPGLLLILIFLATLTTAPASAGSSATAPVVELYVTSWCPYCKEAEKFFRDQGIAYTLYDVEKDSAAARRKDQLDNRRGVPFAVINGEKIHGFSASAYRQALEK